MAIITISRGTASGGQILAECIAAKLGYHCIPPTVLIDAAKEHNVPYEDIKKALYETPGFFDRNSLNAVHYVAYIREAVVKAVKDEQAVYYGLAGQFLLKDLPHVLRVFVIANMEFRAQAAMDRFHCSKSQAIEIIKRIDNKRDKWVKHFYNINRRDPSLYDIVINLDRLSIDGACELICNIASQKEFQATPESQRRLNDLVLSTEVRSTIAANGGINDSKIEVDADDGVIILKGMIHSTAEADKIREVVRKIPDVKDVRSEMRVHV